MRWGPPHGYESRPKRVVNAETETTTNAGKQVVYVSFLVMNSCETAPVKNRGDGMSTKKLIRELSVMVSAMTDEFEIETTNNNHLRITIRRSGRKAKRIAPSTPSDRRGLLNFRSDLRRTYAALAA